MEFRTIREDEKTLFARTFASAMGEELDVSTSTAITVLLEPERSIAATDDGRFVGTGGAITTALTVPGGAAVPAGAVTLVGVLPDHRRQRIADTVMRRLLEDGRERGEAASVLHASESAIYGRWGYAPALWDRSGRIETIRSAFREAAPTDGRMLLLDHDAVREAVVPIFEAAAAVQPGEVARTRGMWSSSLSDPPAWRGGKGPLEFVVRIGPAGPDAYAAFRRTPGWNLGLPEGELHVSDLQALSPEAYAQTWRWLLDVDLVTTVTAEHLTVDEPLFWLLRDPRRLQTTRVVEGLWLRIVDVPAALAGRAYGLDGDLTLRIHDPLVDANDGTWRLDVEGGRAQVSPVEGSPEPDLELGIDALAAVYLGGMRPSALARAGRLTAYSVDALVAAETFFASPVAPRCTADF